MPVIHASIFFVRADVTSATALQSITDHFATQNKA